MTESKVLTKKIAQMFLECFEGLSHYTLIEDAAAECLGKLQGEKLYLARRPDQPVRCRCTKPSETS